VQPVTVQLVGTQAPIVLPLPTMHVAFVPQLSPAMQILVQKPFVVCPETVVQIVPWTLHVTDCEQYCPTPSSLPMWPGVQHEPEITAMSGGAAHTPPTHMREAQMSFGLSPPHGLPTSPQ
jgi:hypothetical protein